MSGVVQGEESEDLTIHLISFLRCVLSRTMNEYLLGQARLFQERDPSDHLPVKL